MTLVTVVTVVKVVPVVKVVSLVPVVTVLTKKLFSLNFYQKKTQKNTHTKHFQTLIYQQFLDETKTLIGKKLKNSNCYKTEKLKWFINSKFQNETKLKTSNCDKTQMMTKLKNSNPELL